MSSTSITPDGEYLDPVDHREEIGLDRARLVDDRLDVVHLAGDVGGVGQDQEAGVLVDEPEDALCRDGRRVPVRRRDAFFLVVDRRELRQRAAHRGVVEAGGDDVGAGDRGQDGVGDPVDHVAAAPPGDRLTGFRAEEDHQVLDPLRGDVHRVLGPGVGAALLVGQAGLEAHSFDDLLRPAGARCGVEEGPLPGVGIPVHVDELVTNLLYQARRKQPFFVFSRHRSTLLSPERCPTLRRYCI